MPKALEYNATLIDKIDVTPALSIFKIRPDEPWGESEIADFVPGQYVTLGLNNEARPELGSVRRPMSIASAPEEGWILEFYIRWVAHPESDNPLTHLLWKTEPHQRIYLRPKAVGKFTLEDTLGAADDRVKVLVAAGTGLAPFLSMARSRALSEADVSLRDLAILHGASYPADLGYRDELEALCRDRELGYACTISRPGEAPDWVGDVGRVEDYFLEDRLGELEDRLGLGAGGLTPDRAVIYICGLQGTIGKTIERTLGRGFVPENRKLRRAFEVPDDVEASLFFEQYDSTPVIEIDNPRVLDPLRDRLHSALARS